MQTNQSTGTRTTETISAGDALKALPLFGHGEVKAGKELADSLAPYFVIKAVFPTITQEAFPMTMDNFRAYIGAYNKHIVAENEEIIKYNQGVLDNIAKGQLNEIEKAYAERFPTLKQNKTLNTREYNWAVEDLNDTYGLIVQKRPMPRIRPATEQFFQNFLHVYNMQLIQRNIQLARHGHKPKRPLQPLSINSYFISRLQRNGVQSLAVCSKTVRNHRMRLEEAGVFMGKEFHGRQRGVTAYVNPQILVIFDTKNEKYIGSENQSFIFPNRKNVPDTNEFTRAYKEEYKEKDDATQSSVDKEQAEPAPLFTNKSIFYKNTCRKEDISPEGAAPESVKVAKTLSEQLRDLILHPQELAESLADHEFDNYTPIDIRLLSTVVYGGTLTNAEFKTLVIQDAMKQWAKTYRGATPYAGNWKKAINRWMDDMFLSHTKDPNGNYHPLGKEAILKRIPEIRWRLDTARNWFASKNTKPLFPYDYFDPTRKTAKERGFEYTKKAWDRRVKYLETRAAVKVKEGQKAKARIERVNHSKKYDDAIMRYLKNKTTLPQLEEYVLNNLPSAYYNSLPADLSKRMAAATLKNHN